MIPTILVQMINEPAIEIFEILGVELIICPPPADPQRGAAGGGHYSSDGTNHSTSIGRAGAIGI